MNLTRDHIKLLQEAEWRWINAEFGAPGIDPKRPFGFSGGYYESMAEILGMELFEDADGEKHLTRAQEDYVSKVWSELLDAIKIIMENADLVYQSLQPKASKGGGTS